MPGYITAWPPLVHSTVPSVRVTSNTPRPLLPLSSTLPLSLRLEFFSFTFTVFVNLTPPFDLQPSHALLPASRTDGFHLVSPNHCTPVVPISTSISIFRIPHPTPVATSSVTQISRLGYIARGRPWSFTVRFRSRPKISKEEPYTPPRWTSPNPPFSTVSLANHPYGL